MIQYACFFSPKVLSIEETDAGHRRVTTVEHYAITSTPVTFNIVPSFYFTLLLPPIIAEFL